MIVITGARGFVGALLTKALLDRGQEVAALDTFPDEAAPRPGLHSVTGDLADPEVRRAALSRGVTAIVHLATVPGGAAEADPAASRRINIDAMYDLLEDLIVTGPGKRFVYASSIAVFGDPLPKDGVTEATPIAPKLIYGGHKAMMETAVSMLSRRGAIDGVTVRLSGILARPSGSATMKSAFMSDVFHALKANRPFTCPVSPSATLWVQSASRCVANLLHALDVDAGKLPGNRTVTLPAERVAMADLITEIAAQSAASSALVSYAPDPNLERAFGSHPFLQTPAAEAAGFEGDGGLTPLVKNVLSQLSHSAS